MATEVSQQEFQRFFDATIKERIAAGDDPINAVRNTCIQMNITLPPQVEQNIIDALKLALSRTPEMMMQTRILSKRIRELMKEGKSTAIAVKDAQTDTNIRLGPEGEKALIQVLEAERERVSDMRVEVVSKEEFKEMMGEQACIPYHLNGKDGWACCKCNQHNVKREDACTMCGHARCDKFK